MFICVHVTYSCIPCIINKFFAHIHVFGNLDTGRSDYGSLSEYCTFRPSHFARVVLRRFLSCVRFVVVSKACAAHEEPVIRLERVKRRRQEVPRAQERRQTTRPAHLQYSVYCSASVFYILRCANSTRALISRRIRRSAPVRRSQTRRVGRGRRWGR